MGLIDKMQVPNDDLLNDARRIIKTANAKE